ncbi:hypothetical protein VP01_2324g2 [Puccinia sorghi]|uniref:Uncharacterized protein n=1 Tax=Puccinia sorghi TaxID=27349 RepID=A0A0L6V9F6_9BASI|nr:hypothetical protein VP01_2324g2 [Puccinia sorghi]
MVQKNMYMNLRPRDRTFLRRIKKNQLLILDSKNYTVLFGNGLKTSAGVIKRKKSQAFELFVTCINENTWISKNSMRIWVQVLRMRLGHKNCIMCSKLNFISMKTHAI